MAVNPLHTPRPASTGTVARHAPELVAGMGRNTQTRKWHKRMTPEQQAARIANIIKTKGQGTAKLTPEQKRNYKKAIKLVRAGAKVVPTCRELGGLNPHYLIKHFMAGKRMEHLE